MTGDIAYEAGGSRPPHRMPLRDRRNESGASALERRRYRRTTRFAYMVLLPSLAVVGLLLLYPLAYAVVVAISGYRFGAATGQLVWAQNFVTIFTAPSTAPLFYQSLLTTLGFTVASVILIVVIALPIALLLNGGFRGRELVMLAILIPYAIPAPVNAVMWKWIFDPNYGVLNSVLLQLGLIKDYIAPTANSSTALWAIVVAYVWKFLPYAVFLFFAGLSSIPSAVYEAAQLDHAGPVRTFTRITLPLLLPVLQMVLIIQTIYALLMHFSLVWVMTNGGPGSATTTLPWLLYQESFAFGQFGVGGAMSVVFALVMTLFVGLYLLVLRPRQRYQLV